MRSDHVCADIRDSRKINVVAGSPAAERQQLGAGGDGGSRHRHRAAPQLFSKLTECDSYCRANRQAWAVDESHRSLRSGIISIPAPILST